MGHRSQYQIDMKQAMKRKAKRKKLAAKGNDLTDYYYGRFYLKAEKNK